MNECPKCSQNYSEHRLAYSTRFVLVCEEDPDLLPTFLGATHEIAADVLSGRCDPAVADQLWADFGPLELQHHLFRLAEHTHTPGASCGACPPGWPVQCRDHGGGCQGFIHATLWNRRNNKRYNQRSRLDPADVRAAYENPKRGRFFRDFTHLESRSCCDHCSSPASRGEIQQAVDSMGEVLGPRRDAAAS